MSKQQIKPNQNADLIVVREKGINAKGFGHVSKIIMTDWTLDLGTKSLYSYLSSAAGSGEEAFLRRARILGEMGIGERAYNKYMSELELHEYIIRAQSRTPGGVFGTTIVEFVMVPTHMKGKIEAAREAETKPNMYSGTIYALGYGVIPRVVAKDIRLSYKARGLYAYYTVFANTNREAFPSRDKILKDLNISKNTFTKLLKELTDKGYLTVKQMHASDGRLGKSIVKLNMFPEEALAKKAEEEERKKNQIALLEPCTKKGTTVEDAPCTKNSTTVENAPCTKNSTTVKAPCTKNACTVAPCPKNSTTVFNITNTIFSTNTNSSLLDRLIDRLHDQIDYRILQFAYGNDPQGLEAIDLMLHAIAQVLTTTNSRVQIGKQTIATKNVCEILMQIDNAATIRVIERYLARTDTVNNPSSYLLASIYNEILMPTELAEEVL